MPAWSGDKINPADLNSGNEWDLDSQVALEELNAMVNGGLYAQTFAEALADAPDNSDANNVGTASVELVDNVKGGKTYKKFKFKNLKGQTGASGNTGTAYRAMGAWSNATAYVNNSEYIDTVQFMGSTYYAKINNTAQSPADGADNTYWGVLALKGSDSSVDIVQTTGTSTTAVMSQNAVTLALDNKVDKEAGKGLSEENFTTTLKDKLDGIQSGLTLSDNLDSPSSAVGLSTEGADTLLSRKMIKHEINAQLNNVNSHSYDFIDPQGRNLLGKTFILEIRPNGWLTTYTQARHQSIMFTPQNVPTQSNLIVYHDVEIESVGVAVNVKPCVMNIFIRNENATYDSLRFETIGQPTLNDTKPNLFIATLWEIVN